MPAIGKAIGVPWIQVRPTWLHDTHAYRDRIRQAGGDISPTDFEDLKAFAKALYAEAGRLDFFPCRSHQNIGTGTQAFSFHGEAASLVNGAMWSTEGILSPSNARIEASTFAVEDFPQATFFAIFKNSPTASSISGVAPIFGWDRSTTGNVYRGIGFWGNVNGSCGFRNSREVLGGQTIPSPGALSCPAAWTSYYAYDAPGEQIFQRDPDGTVYTGNNAAAFVDSPGKLCFGFNATSVDQTTLAFALVANAKLSHSALRSIYDNSLGKGLTTP